MRCPGQKLLPKHGLDRALTRLREDDGPENAAGI